MLGCEQTEYERLVVDVQGRTSVPGVYAAGDIATMGRSVAMAVEARQTTVSSVCQAAL